MELVTELRNLYKQASHTESDNYDKGAPNTSRATNIVQLIKQQADKKSNTGTMEC